MYCVLSAQYKVARAIAKHLNQPTREFADVEADYCPDEVEVDGFVFVESIDAGELEAVEDARHWKDAEALRDYLWREVVGEMVAISIEPHCDDCGYPRDYHAEWCEREVPA